MIITLPRKAQMSQMWNYMEHRTRKGKAKARKHRWKAQGYMQCSKGHFQMLCLESSTARGITHGMINSFEISVLMMPKRKEKYLENLASCSPTLKEKSPRGSHHNVFWKLPCRSVSWLTPRWEMFSSIFLHATLLGNFLSGVISWNSSSVSLKCALGLPQGKASSS